MQDEETVYLADEAELIDEEMTDEVTGDVEEMEPISWQAHEYVHHEKSGAWYLVVLVAVLLLSATVLITKQWLSIGVFVMMAIAVVVYAKRPPRTLTYSLDNLGVHIENKLYQYEQFSSFGVLQDADWHTIDLEPNQRFMPRLSLLFDTADLDAIVARLEAVLPRADRTPDLVERITHSMKF